MSLNKQEIKDAIRENYSKTALNGVNKGCSCGGSCCGGIDVDIESASAANGYSKEELESTVKEANMGLGCGNPVAIAALKEGETVLDLGCGGGFDCFLSRRRVGPTGYVIGVDMTPEMISLARRNAEKSGYDNVDFRLGEIEHLPVSNDTADVIISNCVINLSVDKAQVYREAYRVLKKGGRLSISDIAAVKELPEDLRQNLAKISGCIGGAEHIDKIKLMLTAAGFENISVKPKDNSRELIKSWSPDSGLEEYIGSYIIEAVK